MDDRRYTRDQAVVLLGNAAVDHLLHYGIVPHQEIGGQLFFDAPYIDELLALQRRTALGMQEKYDPFFAHLLYINRLYQEFRLQTWPTKRASANALHPIRERLDDLILRGGVMELTVFIRHVFPVDPRNVRWWTRKGNLAVFVIGMRGYLSVRYARRAIWALTRCETVAQAADRLQRSIDSLRKHVGEGRLPSFQGPDGLRRIDPRDEVWIALQDSGLSVVEAVLHTVGLTIRETSVRLNVGIDAVKDGVRAGDIKALSAGKGGLHIIPEAEIVWWETQFARLKHFSWLESVVQQTADGPVATMPTKEAAAQLRVTRETVVKWCGAGLLPYYTRSFTTLRQSLHLVSDYVEGLARFVGARQVTVRDAARYKCACAETGKIL